MRKECSNSLHPGVWIAGTPYRVVRTLGAGGMGEVYEVDHTRAGTRRAVKVVRESLGKDAASARRLLREARVLRSIDHRNVVRVFEAGSLPDGRPYFAMELLEGTSFKKLTKQAPLSFARGVGLAVQALDGLEAIHSRSVVHRDIKPSNLFLDLNGVVKVLDLGIVKSLDLNASTSTRIGVVVGTTRYMSPEQLTGARVDARTDVYAVGLVLFQLLTGRHPIDLLTDGNAFDRFERAPPSLAAYTSQVVPKGLDGVLQKALEVEPAYRFQTARAFADALRCFLPSVGVSRKLASRAVPVRWERREPCAKGPEIVTARRRAPVTAKLVMVQVAGVAMSLLALVIALGAALLAGRQPDAGSVCSGAIDASP